MDLTYLRQWVTSTGLGSAAACDILIAVSMVYLLHRSRTGFERCVHDIFISPVEDH